MLGRQPVLRDALAEHYEGRIPEVSGDEHAILKVLWTELWEPADTNHTFLRSEARVCHD